MSRIHFSSIIFLHSLLSIHLCIRHVSSFQVPTSPIASRSPFYHECRYGKRSARENVASRVNIKQSSMSLSSNGVQSTVASGNGSTILDEKQLDFTMGYLNKHQRPLLVQFARSFSNLGVTEMKKNAFSGGSYTISNATIVGIDYDMSRHIDKNDSKSFLILEVEVNERGKKDLQVEQVKVSIDAQPLTKVQRNKQSSVATIPNVIQLDGLDEEQPILDLVRRLNRLCHIVQQPDATGKLTQLAIQLSQNRVGALKEDLYLNQVPHNRYVRKYFYEMASKAALEACLLCSNGNISNRMKMTLLFPEMNPSMDAYRIGTLLEVARDIAITLAEQNLRVRVCVQGSMGQGIFTGTPKQLSGAAILLQRMDWQSNAGEENEGMVGQYVNFGAVGKEHVANNVIDKDGNIIQHQDDVFLLLCPQSMQGVDSSIITPLTEMVEAAGDRPVIILNPDLTDKVSSQGQQNIRGRKERMEFADSFKDIFCFRNIYVSGTSYFPILGGVSKFGPTKPWIAYQRRDVKTSSEDTSEIYIPMLSSEEEPSGDMIIDAFD